MNLIVPHLHYGQVAVCYLVWLILGCVDGSHPFYLEMRKGKAHGVFLRNSNGMDVILNDTSLTYRIIGGEVSVCMCTSIIALGLEVLRAMQVLWVEKSQMLSATRHSKALGE